MGYDIECIVDIHNYPGEYFCPVCRTLVYPSEAFQSQCTHLYCKPCLSHVANGSKACPYDGYLVTESDSKPLKDSDKVLAENIGKVKVHCLFFRSGCTWQGTLSECNSHISECTFGNSPVICNRCGTQIVHRQVHEHAQSCPGSYEAQQSSGAVVAASSTTTAVVNLAVTQSDGSIPQPQIPQNVAATPISAHNPNPQLNPSAQASVVAPGAVPTPEQWYQQQYQQYYQHHVAFGTYQQPNQQYYSMQQQPFQQYQQNPFPMQGQHQYQQAPPLVQAQPQPQLQTQPPPMQQPYFQQYPQGQIHPQAQLQDQKQPQLQVAPQAPPQVHAQVHAPVQASAANYPVSQPPHPAMRPLAYVPSQNALAPPQSQNAPYSQATGMQPVSQHPQVPQYQQPAVQMHYPQASQPLVQPQLHSQPLMQPPTHSQTSNQSHMQAQPYHAQSLPYNRPPPPPPLSQRTVPAPPPQVSFPPAPPVTGHHSYQQPQPAQQMQSGFPQPPSMQPPHTLGSLPQQQSSIMAAQQSQGPHQQFTTHAQQPTHPNLHPPLLQPVQQVVPQQYAQQQPFIAPFQGQLHQQGHFQQQPSRPYAPSNPQQSQNFAGRPMMPNPGMHPQTDQQSSGGNGPVSHSGTTQLDLKQTSINQNNSVSSKLVAMEHESRPLSRGLVEMGSDVESAKKEAVGQHEIVLKKDANVAVDGLVKPFFKQEESGLGSSLEQVSGGKSFEGRTQEESNILPDSDPIKQVNQSQEMKLLKPASEVVGPTSTNFNKQSSNEGLVPPKSDGMSRRFGQSYNPNEQREPGYFGPPQHKFELKATHQGPPQIPPPDSRGIIGRVPLPRVEGRFGPQHHGRLSEDATFKDQWSVEGSHPRQGYGNEPNFLRINGGMTPDPSRFGSRDPTQNLDPAFRYSSRAPHANYDAGSNFEPDGFGSNSRFLPPHGRMDNFGPGLEFGQHQMRNFAPRSPGREYRGVSPRGFSGPSIFPRGSAAFDDINGRETHRFGEGSRAINLSLNSANPFHDGRFPPLPAHLQRGHVDGPGNMWFDERMAPRPFHNHNRREGVFAQDGPSQLTRREFSGPGHFSDHFNAAEIIGPGGFHGHACVTEFSGPGNFSGISNNYSGGSDSFDLSRKRRPLSTGWCRICKVDCETVEGLEMHSQTREHQKNAMNMVKAIKQQNKKKHKATSGRNTHGGGRARKFGVEFHGNHP